MPTPTTPPAGSKVFTFNPAKEEQKSGSKSLAGETAKTHIAEGVEDVLPPEPVAKPADTISPAPTMPLDGPMIHGEGANAVLWVNGHDYPLAGCAGFSHYQDEKTGRRYFRLKDQSGNPKEYVNIGNNRNEGYQLASLLLAAGVERGAFL